LWEGFGYKRASSDVGDKKTPLGMKRSSLLRRGNKAVGEEDQVNVIRDDLANMVEPGHEKTSI